MIRYIYAAALSFLLISTAAVHAQDDPDAIQLRASKLIDSTMASLNIRAKRFNQELAIINAVNPLETSSLTKENIAKTREKIKDFLGYLEVYRSLSVKLKEEMTDSVNTLRAKMPSRHRPTFLQEFLDAYELDQGTFDKYTLALTKLYTNIDAVVAFIQTSNVTIKDNRFQFSDKKEYDKYTELMAPVEKSNRKLISASANSQKATMDASEIMQKAYGEIKK